MKKSSPKAVNDEASGGGGGGGGSGGGDTHPAASFSLHGSLHVLPVPVLVGAADRLQPFAPLVHSPPPGLHTLGKCWAVEPNIERTKGTMRDWMKLF